MRLSLLRQTRGNPLFLRMLAANALTVSPPLGKIRDFVTDDDPEHPGTIDLKKYGVRLFIDAARVFALAMTSRRPIPCSASSDRRGDERFGG
jgi:CBS domain-containing protein